jgi:translation initiation factor 2B subunit (eIF-2B alpha/beta/delta family)
MALWAAIIQEIRAEKRAGATALVRRAAEALRLLADAIPAAGADWPTLLADTAAELATARPAFAGLTRLASAALDAAASAASPDEAAGAVRAAAERFVGALDEDAARIVARAAGLLRDPRRLGAAGPASSTGPTDGRVRVLTISASSLVERALLAAAELGSLQVTCLESRPMLEGTALAGRLAEAGLAVTLTLDALGPAVVQEADLVLVGGDSLAPVGLVHKVGTFGLALAAQWAGVPVYALVGPEKLLPAVPPAALADGGAPAELLPPGFASDVPPSLGVRVPYFDLTPLDLLTGVALPDGIVGPAEAARRALAVRLHPRLA